MTLFKSTSFYTGAAFSALFALSVLAMPSAPAHAAADPECPKGESWSSEKGKCIKKDTSSKADDIYLKGKKLAKDGQYSQAIAVLSSIEAKNDPRVLNMLGYSNRKLGRYDVAFSFYNKALEINPKYTLARSYLGEGLAELGRIKEAKQQLSKIGEQCGASCDEYKALEAAIVAKVAGLPIDEAKKTLKW